MTQLRILLAAVLFTALIIAAPTPRNTVDGSNPAMKLHRDATRSPIAPASSSPQNTPAAKLISSGIGNTLFDELIDANIMIVPPWGNKPPFPEDGNDVSNGADLPATAIPTTVPISTGTVNSGPIHQPEIAPPQPVEIPDQHLYSHSTPVDGYPLPPLPTVAVSPPGELLNSTPELVSAPYPPPPHFATGDPVATKGSITVDRDWLAGLLTSSPNPKVNWSAWASNLEGLARILRAMASH